MESDATRTDAAGHGAVTLKDGRYTGETIVKQTDFGIKPPGKSGRQSQRRSEN